MGEAARVAGLIAGASSRWCHHWCTCVNKRPFSYTRSIGVKEKEGKRIQLLDLLLCGFGYDESTKRLHLDIFLSIIYVFGV